MVRVTALLVCIVPLLILLYDSVASWVGGYEATITAAIQKMATKYPELPALTGAFMVWLWLHLFLNHIVARVNHHLPPMP